LILPQQIQSLLSDFECIADYGLNGFDPFSYKFVLKKTNSLQKNYPIKEQSLQTMQPDFLSWCEKIDTFFNDISSSKKIVGYAANSKAGSVLALSPIAAKKIDVILDINLMKTNKNIAGSNIKVKHIDDCKLDDIDCIVLFASHIFDEIIKSKKEPLKLKDIIFDLPQIKANPKPNNYEEESEIPFNKMKLCFGQNISDKSYTDLLNKKVNINYLSSINTYNGKLITPKHLFNHKSRYHNARDLFIYRNLVAGKYLNDPVNKKALSKVTYGVVVDENGVKKVKGFGDKYFKLNPESVSKTIIAHLETDGNSYVHPGEHPRSITPREAARIQSFPDWYFFTGSTRNQFKQIGNAVPPILGSVFAEHFKNVLDLIGKDAR